MQPRLAIVSTPIMRSYTGGLVSAGISTISGFIVTNLDFENLGNNNSKYPTFVVLKVPLEVRHLHGAKRSLTGMYSLLVFISWMPEHNVPVGPTIKQNSPDSFGRFCRGFIGMMYNTFDGSAQTFAFDYSVVQSENVLSYTVLSAIVLLGGSKL